MATDDQQPRSLGGYVIEGVLGEGSLATVYKAQKDGQPCALKILKQGSQPGSVSHRKRLVQVLARLREVDHPMVVRVLDAGELEDRVYVAMELMEYPTLAKRLEQEERIAEGDVVLLARNIAQALKAVAAMRLCHGDLSLRNVFALENNKVKVTDFVLKKYATEVPPDSAVGEAAGARVAGRPEGVPSAEEMLRSRARGGVDENLRGDLAWLARIMISLSGMPVPVQEPDQSFDSYCERLQKEALQLAVLPYSVSAHTTNVIDRLLTRKAFTSAAEAVSELASAAVLRRTAATPPGVERGPRPAAVGRRARPFVAEGAAQERVPTGAGRVAGKPGAPTAEGERTQIPGLLMLWRSEDRGEFFVLQEGKELLVGRDPYICDVILPDSGTSRKHCSVSWKAGELRLKDGGSYHGTFVNGVRVESTALQVGDVIRIGETRISVEPSVSPK